MSDWAAKLQSRGSQSPDSMAHASVSKSTLPEPYNASEVLRALSARYDNIVAGAKADKTGEKARVYRSLESSSAWSTKGGANKKRDDEYNLLFEVNRSIHIQKHRK
ncbi:CIC11C00000001924 [Sungouiella intermedia]|uniref:CIC11C00000001924 n=1 Tax=Sungouiella intermedia TaxID=45354 RepID=A0A1L0BZH5_9ASCO|nr:CIC11C00000001924 [[Candida] intermedia]